MCLGKFALLKVKSFVIAVKLGKEADHLRVGEAPGLVLEIADILYLDAYLFEGLALDRLFKGFADLAEACDQTIAAGRAVAVARHQQLIARCDGGDGGGADLGIFDLAALGANHSALDLAALGLAAAASAVGAGLLPAGELEAGDDSESRLAVGMAARKGGSIDITEAFGGFENAFAHIAAFAVYIEDMVAGDVELAIYGQLGGVFVALDKNITAAIAEEQVALACGFERESVGEYAFADVLDHSCVLLRIVDIFVYILSHKAKSGKPKGGYVIDEERYL